MRFWLCVVSRAVGLGWSGSVSLWRFVVVWRESVAALGRRSCLIPDGDGALRCGGVGLD